MNHLSITAVSEAGNITMFDDFVTTIDGLTRHQANCVAQLLSLATGDDVLVQYIDNEGPCAIVVNHADELKRMELNFGKEKSHEAQLANGVSDS